MISGSDNTPVSDALRHAIRQGAGVLSLLPTVELAEHWEEQFGVGPAPNAESLLESWVRRSSLPPAAAARVRLRRVDTSPIFAAGVGVTAQLETTPSGWSIARGQLELSTLRNGEMTVIRQPGLPTVLSRVIQRVATTSEL